MSVKINEENHCFMNKDRTQASFSNKRRIHDAKFKINAEGV